MIHPIILFCICQGDGLYLEDIAKEYNIDFDRSDYNLKTKKGADKYARDLREKIGFEGYNRLAGEVEARNAEKRMNFTPEQRRARLLAATEDVAREDQLFIYHGVETAAMLENTDNGGMDLEKIKKLAVMPRDALSLTEAEKTAKEFLGKPLINERFDIKANVSGNSLSEMTNPKLLKMQYQHGFNQKQLQMRMFYLKMLLFTKITLIRMDETKLKMCIGLGLFLKIMAFIFLQN